ncbi:hypothetical protein WR25_00344 [Diploscapter pachys]|uniref:Uncharacterized protein n=1 Tax=Diploscapter pachys TaxID=2018661 RepID=A0A2A2M6C2_9BILA|nr:hypothetical protein WR25_00344 [Diploscapter pachys]
MARTWLPRASPTRSRIRSATPPPAPLWSASSTTCPRPIAISPMSTKAVRSAAICWSTTWLVPMCVPMGSMWSACALAATPRPRLSASWAAMWRGNMAT